MKRAVLTSLLQLIAMNSLHAADWEKLPPLPEPNGGFVCGAIGEEIVIAGGTNWKDDTKHWLDRIWIFDPRQNAWRDGGRLATPLAYAAFGATSEGVWFAGGSNGVETLATLARLDPTFAMKTKAQLEPRFVYASSAILGGRLFVIGGAQDQAKLETTGNACFAIELATGKVARLPDLLVPGFVVGATTACGGRVFVFGGAQWDAAAGEVQNLAGAFSYAPTENRWQTLPALPAANRGLAAVTLDDEHILLAGGYRDEDFTDETFLYDLKQEKYRPAKPLPYRALVGLVRCGEYLYCLGGEDRKKNRTDACYRIRIEELLK